MNISRTVLKIYCGPPGTGKTYQAARQAVLAIDGKLPDDGKEMDRYRRLVAGGQIWPVTFHPSYSYEDFVEGFRPILRNGTVAYEVRDGPFKKACDCVAAATLEQGNVLESGGTARFMIEAVTQEVVTLRPLKDGASATRKFIPLAMIDAVVGAIETGRIKVEDLNFSKGERVAAEEKAAVAEATDVNPFYLSDTGLLRALVTHRLASGQVQSKRRVAIVIDEINRGDLSRIFGELMTLLELDKREGMPEARQVFLPYSQTWFSVPRELSVIGTMNTTDKSLSVIDFALRRRFEFEEVVPDPSLCPTTYGGLNVGKLLTRWNNRLTVLRSRDFRIGHAELMFGRLEEVRSENGWLANEDGRLQTLAWTIARKIVPLVVEYFLNEWRKADKVLGVPGLFVPERPADDSTYFEDVADVEEGAAGYDLARWSNPRSEEWDAAKFRTFFGK